MIANKNYQQALTFEILKGIEFVICSH